MENKQFTLDKVVKVSIAIGILTMALSIAYYLVIYMPQRDKAKSEQQVQQRKQAQQALDNCLNTAPSWNYKTEICLKQYPQN